MTTTSFEIQDLRSIFAGCPSGVVAVCAEVDGKATGMVVSTFVPVSLDPPLAGLFIQKLSLTWPVLERGSRLGLSVLGAENVDAARSLSRKSGDRFTSVPTTLAASGAIFVDGSTIWLEGSIWAKTPAGDHHMILLEVHSVAVHADKSPLVFHGSNFHTLS
jgi:flavin reductase (DIM6/NTAB) family NADH-FMN oxidoreductase RutF